MGRVRLIILLGLFLCIDGCSNNRIRDVLETFLSQEVTFPSTLICCSSDTDGVTSLRDSIPKLIIYVDSTQCSSCRVSHLSEYIPLYDDALRSRRYTLSIILSPPMSEYGHIAHLLELYNYPFPVFLDKSHSFRKENGFIPDDARFHAFLTDQANRPVLVGDPVRSKKIRQLFEPMLTEL